MEKNNKPSIESKAEFFEAIQSTGETNANASELNKRLKDMRDSLKEYMIENGIEKAEAGEFSVSTFESTRRSMDENKLIEIIDMLLDECEDEETAELLASCVVYKPTVDEEKVATLVYENILPEEKLAEALKESTSIGMRFGKSSNK